MDVARRHRSLIAWVLYGSILLSAFVCSIVHGHMGGLQLGGVGGLYCSSADFGPAALDDVDAPATGHAQLNALDCPLCGALILGVAALFLLAWLRRPASRPFRHPAPRVFASPRDNWPPANPRAP
ncbi:hypothetical protein D3C76_1165160 [compost metagenome]